MDIDHILKWIYTAKPGLRNRTIKDIQAKDIVLANSLIHEEYTEAQEAIFNGDREEFIDAIIDSIWMVLNYAALGGVTMMEIDSYARLIAVSNYTKFCGSEEEAVQSVFLYGMGQHPDKPLQQIKTYFKKVDDVYVIFREGDDKIMKSYKYESVKDLKNLKT